MTKWYITLLCVTIFLIPSNLFFKFDISHAYVHGLLVDYLIPKLYLSDLPIFAILILWLKELIDRKKIKDIKNPVVLIFSLLLVALFSRQLVSTVPRASLWFFLKLLEMAGLAMFLISHHAFLKDKKIWWTVAMTFIFQAVVGVIQFYTQQSVFHTYRALGEVDFSHTVGLAKDNYFSTENILAYGTTSHPNVLGGFLVVCGLLLLDHFIFQKSKMTTRRWAGAVVILMIVGWSIFMTQSISALLTLVIGLIFLQCKKFFGHFDQVVSTKKNLIFALFFLFLSCGVVPLLLHSGAGRLPGNQSFSRRDLLNQAAESMIIDHPIVGVGLNNFTTKVDTYEQTREAVRFIQPVHNVAILWVAETGLIGVLLIGMTYYVFKQRTLKSWPHKSSFLLPISILLPILALDHYLLTQQTGLLISVFFLFMFHLDGDDQAVTD